jgi:hypothetical protein
MIFQDQRRVLESVFRVKIAASEHLKGVTRRIVRINMYIITLESKKFTME